MTQPTFSFIASGTVETGLATSAAVPSASITADVATGVSPLSLVPPAAKVLAGMVAIGDGDGPGHAHPSDPTVQPTTSRKSSVNSVFIY
jgi:hypothetical protein